MSRRIYQVLFTVIIIVCTALFFKEVKSSVAGIPHLDKFAHFGVFFVLTAFLKRAFNAPFWVYIIILSAYGAGVEYIQGMLPHRSASFADFIADVLGVISYLIFNLVWHKRNDSDEYEDESESEH